MNTYKTSDIARLIGIHVNTVRFYEEWGLISSPGRRENGYRIFTDIHLEQFRLARAALRTEVLQNGLRKKVIQIIKVSAAGNYAEARKLNTEYIRQVEKEIQNAEEAVDIAEEIINAAPAGKDVLPMSLTRKEAAEYLHITMDTLRNWEMNGLLTVKRLENGYRIYTWEDIQSLKIIRSLRCANYSLSSILRMLSALSENPGTDLREAIDSPHADDDVVTACDKLLSSLKDSIENARYVNMQLDKLEFLSFS